MPMKAVFVAACLVLGAPAAASAQAAPAPATLVQSEQFVVHSRQVGADFLIQVVKPLRPVGPGQKTPAVYLLDGTYLLGLAATPAQLMPFENSSRPAYVIGVGFPETDFMAYGARRNRDLIHRVVERPNGAMGGGGAAFERFLKEELRPLIEARYPVDGAQSYLGGHSLGALFAANVLAGDPDAFAGYLIGSPSLQFDPSLPERARAAAAKGRARVFLGVGALEGDMVGRADALEAALRAPGSGLVVARSTFPDQTHVSVQGALIAAGLRHLLPPANTTRP